MNEKQKPEMHPVQTPGFNQRSSRLTSTVTLRAYEVYCHVYAPQPAMIDLEGRGCRGGFSTGELIAFLYARTFPREEWRRRVDEVFEGMENL
ncbi:MAG TPA: hypothetical protein VFE27_22295 [Acidobacteriaceae bacterium]|nr:hypothetical protein [Acidobacteriaceae bacterium]